MVCACNTCDNFGGNDRWCYIYQREIPPHLVSKPNKCRAWSEWDPKGKRTEFINNVKVVR